MATPIVKCSTCRNSLPNDMYDLKRDGQYKRTCRTCLSTSKAKYNAKAAHVAMRDTKKIRNDLITAIYIINDSNILTQMLTLANTSLAPPAAEPI